MKNKYKKKVYFNLVHIIVLVLGILLWLFFINEFTFVAGGPQLSFFESLFNQLTDFGSWMFMLFYLIILYGIVTLISWIYYKKRE